MHLWMGKKSSSPATLTPLKSKCNSSSVFFRTSIRGTWWQSTCKCMKRRRISYCCYSTNKLRLRLQPTRKYPFYTHRFFYRHRLHVVLRLNVFYYVSISVLSISMYLYTGIWFSSATLRRVLMWIRNWSRQLDLLALSLSFLVRSLFKHYYLTKRLSTDRELVLLLR